MIGQSDILAHLLFWQPLGPSDAWFQARATGHATYERVAYGYVYMTEPLV